jgi:hypothetical protein
MKFREFDRLQILHYTSLSMAGGVMNGYDQPCIILSITHIV